MNALDRFPANLKALKRIVWENFWKPEKVTIKHEFAFHMWEKNKMKGNITDNTDLSSECIFPSWLFWSF